MSDITDEPYDLVQREVERLRGRHTDDLRTMLREPFEIAGQEFESVQSQAARALIAVAEQYQCAKCKTKPGHGCKHTCEQGDHLDGACPGFGTGCGCTQERP